MSGKIFTVFLAIGLLPALSLAQQGTITGTITDEATGEEISGANVILKGTNIGAAANNNGVYTITNAPLGEQTIVVTSIGYTKTTAEVTVMPGISMTVDISMNATDLQLSAVTVTSNFARERETPVAFTTIGEDHIKNNFTVQDIPHLFANTPGVYVMTDGGAGMGDSKVLIRGFDEQRIAVMINNVPVNDPESKKVYWSNWGSLPAASQSIQIQRGAGTSLYGSGAMGGSINVVTKDAPANKSIGLNFTGGENGILKGGIDYNSGLMGGNKAFIARFNYMEGNGWRQDTYYKGLQYYFSAMLYPNESNTFKLILHGAPQYHAYSYYGFGVADFAKYGRDWNGHPHVADGDLAGTIYADRGTNLLDVLFNSTKIGEAAGNQKGGLIIGNGRASFDNNVFHKPQLELHHSKRFESGASLTTTAFASKGFGYGENLDSYYKVSRDDIDGNMTYADIDAAGVYQYRNYSDHFQTGLLSSFNSTLMGKHDLTVGGEFRYWTARHAGEILNTFSKDLVSYFIGNEKHKFAAGDLYYDYTTNKPQFTGFGHMLWKFMDGRLNVMTDAQFSTLTYKISEDVPNNGNYPGATSYTDEDGKEVSKGTRTWSGTGNEGSSTATYTLFDYEKTYSYVSPKFGANYNVSEVLNVFANWSKAVNEPRVKFFFAYGSPNDALKLEETSDIELGFGYRSEISGMPMTAKFNWYNIDFSGKALRIQDPTKANTQGYDYKGRRYIPIGDSNYTGLELALNTKISRNLDWGFNLSSATNEWGEPDGSEGAQNLYSNADVVAGTDYTDTDGDGKWDAGEAALHSNFVGQFGNRVEVGMPQLIIGSTLNYSQGNLNLGMAFRSYSDTYILENNGESVIEKGADGDFGTDDDIKSKTLPSASVIDLVVRYNLSVANGTSLSLHINNLLDEEYWQKGDSYGFGPGAARTMIASLNVTL